jgi:hypothetical protein
VTQVTKFDPAGLLDFTQQGVRELARRLGVDPAVLCRPISAWQVDRFCVRIGQHPHAVYGDAIWPEPECADDPLTPEELEALDDYEFEAGLWRYDRKVAAGLA